MNPMSRTAVHLDPQRREAALRGMWKSVPDVGIVRLRTYEVHGKRVLWVPMFAANDRESVILALKQLQTTHAESSSVIGILNKGLNQAEVHFSYQDMIKGAVILAGHDPEPVRMELMPRVTFCRPQIASARSD